ncbi:MAG: hypothetical protein EA392_14645 [Cryomorphaceae bacterium]|nr:MAG: hypothetical protein EA392_14645 [Cryomorphaceae bacterium]
MKQKTLLFALSFLWCISSFAQGEDLIVTTKLDSIWCDIKKAGKLEVTYQLQDSLKTLPAEKIYFTQKKWQLRPKYYNENLEVKPFTANDLIVKTTLDSIECNIQRIGTKQEEKSEIFYLLKGNPEKLLSINKRDVFYVAFDLKKSTTKGDSMFGQPTRQQFFNTDFDYAQAYQLKTGRIPLGNDPHWNFLDSKWEKPDDWRFKAGKKLRTAGSLMLGSFVLSAAGIMVLTSTMRNSEVPGFTLLGAGTVSMIGGYIFVIGAGNAMQGR